MKNEMSAPYSASDLQTSVRRILAGEKVTVVVSKANEAALRAGFAKLSPRLQANITIKVLP